MRKVPSISGYAVPTNSYPVIINGWIVLTRHGSYKLVSCYYQLMDSIDETRFLQTPYPVIVNWWIVLTRHSSYKLVSCYYQLMDSIDETRFLQTRILLLSTDG